MANIKIKSSASIRGLQFPMRKVLIEANRIYNSYNRTLVITSGLDGAHSSGSLHYYGYALDLRTFYFTKSVKQKVAKELANSLGANYYVLLESNHIHVHYELAKKLFVQN